MGAPAERIRALGGSSAGDILPFGWSKEVTALNNAFVEHHSSAEPLIKPANVSYPSLIKDYYGLAANNTDLMQVREVA